MTGEVDDVPGGTVAADQPNAIALPNARCGECRGATTHALGKLAGANAFESRSAPHHEKVRTGLFFQFVEQIGKRVHGGAQSSTGRRDGQKWPDREGTVIRTEQPTYIPMLLPNDLAALREIPPQQAMMISAVCASSPRLQELAAGARARAETLLVDPKTPHFQFEGYMSMPDHRALPYSPGQGSLGTLWQPARFSRPEARRDLINAVFEVQRGLGADVLLAPYFYIPHYEHPWLEVSRACAHEAIAAESERPVGVPLCIDIDALIDPQHLTRIAAAYHDVEAALFWVTLVNYDERRADPRDAHTVMAFLQALQETGAPVVLSHTGRTGLVAIARGAAGYSAGSYGLESHPRSFFREMMGSRLANSYYLHECYFHLAVRAAQTCLQFDGPEAHPPCDCPACDGGVDVTRMVSRRLGLHSMSRRIIEVDALRAQPPNERCSYLVERFGAALQRAAELSAALAATGAPPLRDGDFHYLEILREAAGGPAATIPRADD